MMRWFSVFAGTFALVGVVSVVESAEAAPANNVHNIDWYVHVDLINVGAGEDLAFYQGLIESRSAAADLLVQGHQGPIDNGCCVTLDPVSVTTFGSPGDGLDVIETSGEIAAVINGGAASGGYLVQSVFYCNGFSTSIVGCANSPGDRFVVGLDADASDFLPATIAHERGHNTGLNHVTGDPCELMSASSGGGCLSISECNSFISDADTTSGTCECLADTLGDAPTAPGTACTIAGGGGVCNGGGCGDAMGSAGSRLVIAGGPGAVSGVTTDRLVDLSPLTGDWDDVAGFGATLVAFAYDFDTGVLYGIESRVGDDALVIVDPVTGSVTSTVGVLSGREVVTALAFDPGSPDRLLAFDLDDTVFASTPCSDFFPPGTQCSTELFEIDPVTASQTQLGELSSLLTTNGMSSLAWDDANGVLYAAGGAGFRMINIASCNGTSCGGTHTLIENTLVSPVSLGWDSVSGEVYRVGQRIIGQTEVAAYDPVTMEITVLARRVQAFTGEGLAAIPVPEPGFGGAFMAGVVFLRAAGCRRG